MANKDFLTRNLIKSSNRLSVRIPTSFLLAAVSEDSRGDNGNFDNWSGYQPTKVEQAKSKKPLYIVLLCLALILCIALGWFYARYSEVSARRQNRSGCS